MKPFAHKSFVGDFFDVLSAGGANAKPGETTRSFGGTKRREAVVSILAGDFTPETLPGFAASLESLLTSTVQLIVLDLSRAHVFSANAASVLVNFLAGVEGRGKRLVLYRPNRMVRDILVACSLTTLFEIRQTEEELLLALPDQSI